MQYHIVIIGGGIVGLATALRSLEQNPKLNIIVLEKENAAALHQTANNSGVIHSGLYYKPCSLKATNCIRGYHQLIEFCQAEEVPYEICGKIVVAARPEQVPLLDNLYERGKQNGLQGLKKLTVEEMKEYEPYVTGVEGMYVPQTGIVDYKVVSDKMAAKIGKLGGTVQFGEKVNSISKGDAQTVVKTQNNEYQTKLVVNCAGLYSDKVTQMSEAKPINLRIVPFRGEYYKIKPEKHYLVKNLIYPVPNPNFPFLGVHFTRMKRGGIEAGPNAVLAFAREGYKKTDINIKELLETLAWPGFQKVALKYWETGFGEMYRSFSKTAFTKALQELIPDIRQDDLMEGGAGVRAQACDRDGGLVDDFSIIGDEKVINICNAPSPAATSSLSIGQTVSEMALRYLN